ncbi:MULTISPECIES: ribonuclease E/G [unclassified Iodidimonas]|jgi:ribonuclease G|uniref:ribonuclease E/G n=1 Tax=unclassified Iodidimonas TaxID=2626145 RepID=UPI0024832160|nr:MULTISPECIES: ribonuclease E/G [unclassified Iodidimonas]
MADLLIEASAGEIRTALVDETGPLEIGFHRGRDLHREAIVLARVSALAPDINSAFVELEGGVEGGPSCPLSGLLPCHHAPFEPGSARPKRIGDAVHVGQKFCVELMMAPNENSKSWVVRADYARKGRYLTLTPFRPGLRFDDGFDLEDKNRLGEALTPILKESGVAAHAPAQGIHDDVLMAEAARLLGQIRAIRTAGGGARQILAAASALKISLRDAPPDLGKIYLSDRDLLAQAQSCLKQWPDLLPLLDVPKTDLGLFADHGVEEALDALIDGHIALPSGGMISIDETRAATVIDVDSAKATAGQSAGQSGAGSGRAWGRAAFEVNCEAARVLARLLRFGRIGGLVVIDFIDMQKKDHKDALIAAFDAALADDPLPVRLSGINAHGILTLTRKRLGPSVREMLLQAPGPRLSLYSLAHDLLRRAERTAIMDPRPGTLVLSLSPALGRLFEGPDWLARLSERTGRVIDLRMDESVPSDQPLCHIG